MLFERRKKKPVGGKAAQGQVANVMGQTGSKIDPGREAAAAGVSNIIDAELATAVIDHVLEEANPSPTRERMEWRGRDRRIVASVLIHPRTTQQIFEKVGDIIPRKDSLCRRLNRLRRKGRIRHQGTIQLNDVGRPTDWYCSWNVPRGTELHELELTDVCDKIEGEWRRGRLLTADVTAERRRREEQAKAAGADPKSVKLIWPDAILLRSGTKYYVEYDSGEQRETQLTEKFLAYEKCEHALLFITRETRDHLANVATYVPKGLVPRILLTTYDLVMGSEGSEIWYGTSLKSTVALPSQETVPETVQGTAP